jgi:sugar phosphate isomerase/epimerase
MGAARVLRRIIRMPSQTRKYAIIAAALTTDPRQAPTIASKLGFEGLLFDAFSTEFDITHLSVTGRREFRHMLSAQDRQLVGLRVDLGAKGFGPGADVDRLLAQFDSVLQSAAALASPLVCVEAGPLPEPPRENKPKPKVTPEQAGLILIPTLAAAPAPEVTRAAALPPQIDPVFVAQVDGAMAELGRLADRYSAMLAFRSDLASFAAIQRALIAARCPWFGIDLDPVAILRDEWDIDEIFSRVGSLIRHVRARDAVSGADRRTKPATIGRGDTKWDQLLGNLDGASYHGWITLDPTELTDRIAAATAGLKYLKLHE